MEVAEPPGSGVVVVAGIRPHEETNSPSSSAAKASVSWRRE